MTAWFDEESTTQVLRSLVGQRLEAVRYLVPAGMPPTAADTAGEIHEIDHGVQLQTSAGLSTLMWQLDGDCAALSAILDAGEEDGITDLIEAVDVTDALPWRSLAGKVVIDVAQARHRSVAGCPTTTWACRLDLGDSGRVVVALGEIRGDRLTYSSNNVAVLFGRDTFDLFCNHEGDARGWSVPISDVFSAGH